MEAITKKLSSCKCNREVKNADGQQDCGTCRAGVECTCKINKCKCASCPNKKTKEAGDASSSSSSDDDEARTRRTAGATGTTTTTTL